MTNFLIYLPFIISFLTGFFIIDILMNRTSRINFMLQLALAGGLGLGLNAHITFFSFILLGQFNPIFTVSVNITIAFILSIIFFKRSEIELKKLKVPELLPYLFLAVFLIPLYIHAKFYPLGGWDAWSVWNFKAKFLFLSGDTWKNIFSPILWRSSPHYPLLLPMINIWGWSFLNNAVNLIPQITSVIFTMLTMLLLYTGLKDLTRSYFAILAPVFLLSTHYFLVIATSQYCDIIVGYYLLASLFCLIKSKKDKNSNLALLSGFFLGLLSFTKPEGLISTLIILSCSFIYFFWQEKSKEDKKSVLFLLFGAFIFAIPTLIFQVFYAPANQTMINGLASKTNPSTLLRLKTICIYSLMELKSNKWTGVWIILLLSLILSFGRCFSRKVLILPLYFILYSAAVILYYFINTQFEITWWLQSTSSRLLFAVLPTVFFWAFYSLWLE